jgi:hypothetical protein
MQRASSGVNAARIFVREIHPTADGREVAREKSLLGSNCGRETLGNGGNSSTRAAGESGAND